ncbi:hypothetical protein B5G11_04470 [Drancourtella sp. An57]|nr:hypothetical protein B5G11_04470 [Drancourtella sp. An57]
MVKDMISCFLNLYVILRYSIYIGSLIFICLFQIKRRKWGLYTWRICSGCTVVDVLITSIFNKMDVHLAYDSTILMFMICFIISPFLWEVSTCKNCGRRLFLLPLFRNRCPCCSKLLY